jgi:hypothetical protein
MPYEISRIGQDKGVVVNTTTGRHFSNSPIPLANAEKQIRLLRAIKMTGWRPTGKKPSE